ncbi:NADPH-dependent assimilatory sulfite reductase hemoprotein subunit [Flagellimonas sp.]|uniref:NADPH-dependent assimilatory sulfite reductase hemoprotein subunit n=1 Tax=Flagellimonas sp. TaxID=2058762 RepID=UPI003AB489FE
MRENLVEKRSKEEGIKDNSNYLRGTIAKGLGDPLTGAIAEDDAKLLKFHGSYQQHDRDLEKERRQQKLEPLYQFMLRVRIAGGVTTPEQWLVMDELADRYGNGTLKLTTRQSFQMHGILKGNLKPTIKTINEALMTTIATCGDVNRNVMCNPNPYQSKVHGQVYALAREVSDYFQPRTKAYYELWLDHKREIEIPDQEPLYKKTYLPRKFKIAFCIPPHNDVDIYANDLGFVAIVEAGRLQGFTVIVGGGMGMTFGDDSTYPRLGTPIGFVAPDQVLPVAEAIVSIQRDYGNRVNRKQARFKYTIDNYGIDWLKNELSQRFEGTLEVIKPFRLTTNGDQYGWVRGIDGHWFHTLFVENGRIKDTEGHFLKTAIRKIAELGIGDLRLTGNQNLIIGSVPENDKSKIEEVLKEYHVHEKKRLTGLRLGSMACVALNTCGLAFAESERYLPSLLDKFDVLLQENGLEDRAINIRMTGCPNGCARSALAEIGFIGRAPGRYNMYLGASHNGDRLNRLYREMLSEEEILAELAQLLKNYAKTGLPSEHFGDYVIRMKIV